MAELYDQKQCEAGPCQELWRFGIWIPAENGGESKKKVYLCGDHTEFATSVLEALALAPVAP